MYEGFVYDPYTQTRERIAASTDPYHVFETMIEVAERWGRQKIASEFAAKPEGAITQDKLDALFPED